MTERAYSAVPMAGGIYRAFQYRVWVNGKPEGEPTWTPVYRFDSLDHVILAMARWYNWRHSKHESPVTGVPEIVRPTGNWLSNHVEMPIIDTCNQEHGLAIWCDGERVGYVPRYTRFTRIDGEVYRVWGQSTIGRGELTLYTGPDLSEEEIEELVPAGN